MSDAVKRVSVEISGKEISFETGKLAKQATGAVVVRAGDTMVLCTAVVGNLRDADFLPLTVDVEERMYAAGKIPGSFFKREGRAGEKGTLTARMIDRPIRPLFPKGWRFETQLVAMPLSVDHVNPYDILAINGASTALQLSGAPVAHAVGAVRIGKVDGNFVVNPDEEDLLDNTDLDLIVAGTSEGITMVEAGANEIPEAEILDALDIAHDAIKQLVRGAGRAEGPGRQAGRSSSRHPACTMTSTPRSRPHTAPRSTRPRRSRTSSSARTRPRRSRPRSSSSTPATRRARATPEAKAHAQRAADKLEKSLIRERIAIKKIRPDGRGSDEIRQIDVEVSVTPRTHGSALFTRGQTQVLSASRSAPRVRRCAWTRSVWRPPSATSTTTTSRPSASARPAVWAGPSAATSATVRSLSARSCR